MNASGRRRCLAGAAGALALATAFCAPAAGDAPQPGKLDVPYEPTHPEVVDAMLKLAKVTREDVVYDLGCGDGRIVVAAAKKLGARGAGMDLDPERIKEAVENAQLAGVADRVKFSVADIMTSDLREATVVTMYLLESVNRMVRPKLFADLKPGTRIVSHAFSMGDWEHDGLLRHPKARNNLVYLWIVPAAVGGTWEWAAKAGNAEVGFTLALTQEFQAATGTLAAAGGQPAPIRDATIAGTEIKWSGTWMSGAESVQITCRGTVSGDTIQGTQEWRGGPNPGTYPWAAKRKPLDLAGAWRLETKAAEPPLSGTLLIERRGAALAASYTRDKDNRTVPLPDFCLWGASVRFELPGQGQPTVFRGNLDAQTGQGTAYKEGWERELPWTARRKPQP